MTMMFKTLFFIALASCLATEAVGEKTVARGRGRGYKRGSRKMPTLEDVLKVAVDTIFEEGFNEEPFITKQHPKIPASLASFDSDTADQFKFDPELAEQSCDQVVNSILGNLPGFGSVFYVLVNGWYLG